MAFQGSEMPPTAAQVTAVQQRQAEYAALMAKWAANAPLAMVDQYIGNLRRLKAIAFDAGDKDTAIAATVKTLDEMLTGYDLPHTFAIYGGTHTSAIAERVGKQTLPFFSQHLKR